MAVWEDMQLVGNARHATARRSLYRRVYAIHVAVDEHTLHAQCPVLHGYNVLGGPY